MFFRGSKFPAEGLRAKSRANLGYENTLWKKRKRSFIPKVGLCCLLAFRISWSWWKLWSSLLYCSLWTGIFQSRKISAPILTQMCARTAEKELQSLSADGFHCSASMVWIPTFTITDIHSYFKICNVHILRGKKGKKKKITDTEITGTFLGKWSWLRQR